VTAQDVRMAAQAEAAQRAAAGVSTADELAKLNQLRSQGVIDDAEYEDLKKKALA
jgi:putative oligomerization/nucleic acid binding protein